MKGLAAKIFAVISMSVLGVTLALTEDFSFLSDKFAWSDFATMAGPTGTQYSFCWTVYPCADCVQPYNIQFRKYRAEGGQQYMSNLLHVSEWVVHATNPDGSKEYCANDSVPMGGHWVYEARVCGPNPTEGGDPICTIGTSIDPAYAKVKSADGTEVPRAWWVYTFLAPPGTPEVDMKWYNRPSPNQDKEVVPSLNQPKEVLANATDR